MKEHATFLGVNLETNKKLGYFIYNNEIYYNKYHAMLSERNSTGASTFLNGQTIKWMFNEQTFVSYPWHIEPEESLQELYRRRAQQLRDQYDYIRVEASGGGDSTTVIYSFLLNGIHLDEVVFRYPKKGDKNATSDAWDTTPENTLSEWDFAAKPLLHWIKTNFPATKVVVHDYTDQIENAEDESWVLRTKHFLQPGHAFKHTNFGIDDHKRDADKDLKIAIVYGVDKPRICVKDGKFWIYFADFPAAFTDSNIGDYTNVTNELFYWSPDACDLLCKQAHTVKKWFSMPQNYQFQRTLNWPNNDFANRTLYEHVIKSIIYPDYDCNTFQVAKPTNNVFNEMDYWFHQNCKNTKEYQVWQAGVNYILNNINEKYVIPVKGNKINIAWFMSPFYYIGECNIPSIGAVKQLDALTAARNDQNKYVHCIQGRLAVY